MINFENLDEKSALEIFSEAGQKIEFLNPDWTYKEESDPGVTLLELLSWLKSDQHKYLNKISSRLKIKLLKLLGIKLKRRTGSKALLQINNCLEDVEIPRRTKWRSGSLVFENLDSQFLSKSDILSIRFNNPEFIEEYHYYNINGTEKIFIFGDKNTEGGEIREFEIRLSNAFPKNKDISFYFEIYSDHKRNEINSDSFKPFASIKWQYWGISKEKECWQDFDFQDYTHNFLFSGRVLMRHFGQMSSVDGIYLVKCVLINSDYDFMPKVSNIRLNVFEVNQCDTKCESVFIENKKLKEDENYYKFKVRTNLSLYGHNSLYKKKDDAWICVEDFELKKEVNQGFCEFKVKKDKILSFDNKSFLLVSYSDDMKSKITLGSGTDFSGLTFDLDFKDLSIYDECQIMVGTKNNNVIMFNIWERVEDFFQSSKFDKHFVYEENGKIIAFGDNHRGAIPEKGDNNIRFSNLSFTKGSESNLREGMINEVESESEILKNIKITQISPAEGGRNDESLDEGLKRISKNIKRAVTLQDYKEVVKNTPGLILKDVVVFASDNQENKIYISIRLPNSKRIPLSYKKNIISWLENFRLINTEIEVLSPTIVNLNIKIKLTLKSGYLSKDQFIKDEISLFIKNINKNLGQNLIYGDLFQFIEKMDCVHYINNLEIIKEDKNKECIQNDDENCPINLIYELDKIDLVSLVSTEF